MKMLWETYSLLQFKHEVFHMLGGIIHTSPLCVKAQVQNNQSRAQSTLFYMQINRYSWAFSTTTPPFFPDTDKKPLQHSFLFTHCASAALWWMNVLVILHAPFRQCRWLPPAGSDSVCHILLSLSSPHPRLVICGTLARCRWFLPPAETKSECVWL